MTLGEASLSSRYFEFILPCEGAQRRGFRDGGRIFLIGLNFSSTTRHLDAPLIEEG